MAKRLLLVISLATLVLLLFGGASCQQRNVVGKEIEQGKKHGVLQLYGTLNDIYLKAYETTWERGDQIGLFASAVGATFGNKGANLPYQTVAGDGSFSPVGTDLQLTAEPLSLTAYYPYQPSLNNNSYAVALSDQSNPAKIDLLYSNNVSGIHTDNAVAVLQFGHKLSQVVVELQGVDGVDDLAGIEVTLDDVVVDGTMSIVDGSLQIGTQRQQVRFYQEAQSGNKARMSAILFPGERLLGKQFTFKLGGNTYQYTWDKDWTLTSNTRYRIRVVLGSEGTNPALIDSSTIEGWDIVDDMPIIDVEQDEGGTTPPPAGNVVAPALSVQDISLEPTGGLTQAVQIKAAEGTKWDAKVASNAATWLSIDPATGTGTSYAFITAQENNTPYDRVGTITISASSLRAGANEVVITVKQKGKPTPPPPPPPSNDRAWYMEIPLTADGQPIPGTYEDIVLHMAPDSWFGGTHYTAPDGKRRNYSLLFSTKHNQPLWVAYPLYTDCMGGAKRTNAWEYDPILPRQYQPNLGKSYVSGYSRGHMLASGARTASRSLNETTFYYTNMIPQLQTMNGGGWNGFEQKEQTWSKQTNRFDTLYVVTGPILPISNSRTVGDGGNKRITIPTHSFKVLLRQEKSTGKWYSIGLKMPNTDAPRSGNSWPNYIVSVKSLEEELGFRFFTHLDPAIADEVKSQTDLTHWQ